MKEFLEWFDVKGFLKFMIPAVEVIIVAAVIIISVSLIYDILR
jgi:hypothetical protein